MIPIAFVAVFMATAALFYGFGPELWAGPPTLTVYDFAYVGTLTVATIAAWRSRDSHMRRGALLLWTIFLWHWICDQSGEGEKAFAFGNLVVAGAFIVRSKENWELACGAMFSTMVLSLWASSAGYIPGAGQCGPQFVPWCLPAVVEVQGHLAAIILGLAADARPLAPESSRGSFLGWLRRDSLGMAHRFIRH
jgi:hypothetical protein